MIVTNAKSLGATNALMYIGIACLAGLLGVILLVKKPDTSEIQAKRDKEIFAIRQKTKDAEEQLSLAQNTIRMQTWTLPEPQVGPTALAQVTALVKQNGLNLISFRPQRRNEDGKFVQLPFLLTIEGSYPKVVNLLKALEKPQTKLAVTLAQVASSDAASDAVTGSIGLVAYLDTKVDAPAKGTVNRG